MATITTTPTLNERIFPFVGTNEVISRRTDLPRSTVRYSCVDVSIPASGAGNDRAISCSMAMPENFAYALTEVEALVRGPAGGDIGFETAFSQIELFVGSTRVRRVPLSYKFDQGVQMSSVYRKSNVFRVEPPKEVFLPDAEGMMFLTFQLMDATINGPDALFSFNCRFLQFDVNQAHHVAVNTPTLTR